MIEKDDLMQNAEEIGNYLMGGISEIEEIENVRGRGLMIGFDVPEELKDLRKNLLQKHHIFTGVASPNVIRLLPALNLSKVEADKFLNSLKEEVAFLLAENKPEESVLNH